MSRHWVTEAESEIELAADPRKTPTSEAVLDTPMLVVADTLITAFRMKLALFDRLRLLVASTIHDVFLRTWLASDKMIDDTADTNLGPKQNVVVTIFRETNEKLVEADTMILVL